MSGVGKELFLSYGREPEVVSFVEKLKHDLEGHGFTVWLDTEDIPAGSDWHGAIGTGLDQCRALIAVITKKYINSRYCTSELYTANSDQKQIFPVIFEDVDFSTTQQSRGVKYAISGINWTMFRVGVDDYNTSLRRLVKGMREKGLAGGMDAVGVSNDSTKKLATGRTRAVSVEHATVGESSIQKTLMDAVKRGRIEKVKECHQQGAQLTATDGMGWTPLHHAARLDRKEIAQYLVENLPKEALDSVEDEKLQTALHKAAWYGYETICRILVEQGASLSKTDYQGNTPYLKSLQCGDTELQQYLKRKELQQLNQEEEEEVAL